MASDDKAARKARAEKIRARARRPDPDGPAGSGEPSPSPPEESPRDFVERRMREIDAEKKPKV